MARYVDQSVTLSAGQAAGTTAILLAESGSGGGNRKYVRIASRSAAAVELFLASGGTPGLGLPIAIGGAVTFTGNDPGLDNAVFIVGASAGEKINIWTA